MVKAEELYTPTPPTAAPQPSEDETRRAPPHITWWPLRRAPIKPPFDDIWQAERPRVQALATRLTGNRDDAEDITQEVAVRALRGWENFRGDADVRTWLYRITLNLVASLRTIHHEPPSAHADIAAPRDDQPEERLLRAEGSPAVRRALDMLPDDLRTPLVLQVYEEMKCREIADLLGLPLGTVLTRLYTACKRLLILLSEGKATQDAL